MRFTRKAVEQVLEDMVHGVLGMDASPYKDQVEALVWALVKRTSVLLLQPTGWGKSMVYFAASELLRSADKGVVVVVSPLIALMQDQVESLQAAGVAASFINSNLDRAEQNRRYADFIAGKIASE